MLMLSMQGAVVLDFFQREIGADGRLGDFLAIFPLQLECIDIEFDVVHGRMPRRQVFGLDQRAALRAVVFEDAAPGRVRRIRSEEHTSELQSLMRISYAVFCLKKKTTPHNAIQTTQGHRPQVCLVAYIPHRNQYARYKTTT